jgi:Cu-Zn family superoxide dismutase
MRILPLASALVFAACAPCAFAADLVVPMELIDATGSVKAIGSVTISESTYGLVFSPDLDGLPPGVHGFHVHENPSCKPQVRDGQPVAGLAAGGHYDPAGTKRHGAPWGDGHLGDLPGLVVDGAGRATYPVLAPRLKLQDVKARSLMIHMGGDNHADHPMPLGGGGARMACGVIGG